MERHLVIGLAALVAVGITFWFMVHLTDQDPNYVESTPDGLVQIVDLCAENKRLEVEVRQTIEASRACRTHSDCQLVFLSCPLGCFQAVNAAQVSAIKDLHEKYQNTKDECPGCKYRCPLSDMSQPKCESGLCVVTKSETWRPNNYEPYPEPSRDLP